MRRIDSTGNIAAHAQRCAQCEAALRAAAPAPVEAPLFERNANGETLVRGVGVLQKPDEKPGAKGGTA